MTKSGKSTKKSYPRKKSLEFYIIQRNNLPKSDKTHGKPLLAVAEFCGGHPCFAAEVTAESSLFLEAQHIGDDLYGEVATHVQEHLGFGHHLGVYPVGGGVASLLTSSQKNL